MKKTISLLLAILMIVAAVPAMSFAAAAEGDPYEPVTKYVVYTEDFENLSAGGGSAGLLDALGWYVPEGEEDSTIAEYTITTGANGEGSALRISTLAPKGLENDSLVTVFGGDVMSLVRNGDYTVAYDLTYRAGTTNTKGYSTLIYNYNEQSGRFVGHEGEGASYGYAPVRVCGTGFNNVYYPITGGSVDAKIEDVANAVELAMTNRYTASGAFSSLYSKIAASLGDTEFVDQEVYTGAEQTLIDKTIRIRIEVDYQDGPSVFINDILVSVPTVDYTHIKQTGNAVWGDFITRTTGASIGLLTKHNVVADIDNISVETAELQTELASELPELVITELAPNPHGDYTWGEYIELYNTTDRYLNLADYSLMLCDVNDGASDTVVSGNQQRKYDNMVNLAEVLGKPVKSGNYYLTDAQLSLLGESRYELVDNKRYNQVGSDYKEAANGYYRKIKYVERWNERYSIGEAEDPTADYAHNTYLAPGECVVLHPMLGSDESFWKAGVNGSDTNVDSIAFGTTQTPDGTLQSFRSVFKGSGLSDTTKVVAFSNFNLADMNSNGAYYNVGTRRYYVGKSHDTEGNAIAYKSVYIDDANYDQYIVCWADWNTPLIAGKTKEEYAPGLSAFGQVGLGSKGHSGVWVYGVDASDDPRRGTLYVANNKTNGGNSHVGKLAGYQQILMGDMYAKNDGSPAELSITEIVPRTYDLNGFDNSAFTAMELTNTSKGTVDLYRYALVRNELGLACNAGKGFTRSVVMRAGNPVDKGLYNGAYYYFIENHISNPETCILQPGESVVIWFLSTATYTTYTGDDDFGFDYFREYWTKNGSPELSTKNADGEYKTKVIAVDGHEGTTFNADNGNRVFELSPTSAAVYGIAPATQLVKEAKISTKEVISVAFLGISACYYDLKWSTYEEDGRTYYVNILEYTTLPANQSMRYIAGGAGSSRCSAMVDSMKVQYADYTTGGDHVWYTQEEGKLPIIVVRTNNAMQQPRLGVLNGEEVLAIADHLFVAEEAQNGDVTYRYFDSLRADVQTLSGAAIETTGSNPQLRFDCVVPLATYSSLSAVYGQSNFKVGTLIVESSAVSGKTSFTREDLDKAGIAYTDVSNQILYRTSNYAVLGASFTVLPGNYDVSYTAVSYMEVKLADGTVKTFWSPNITARSLAEVADRALSDTKDEQNEIYCHQTADGEYSRYDDFVQTALRSYLGI